jgi:hypothetical protein
VRERLSGRHGLSVGFLEDRDEESGQFHSYCVIFSYSQLHLSYRMSHLVSVFCR